MVFYLKSGRPWRGRARPYTGGVCMAIPYMYKLQNAPLYWPSQFGPSHPMVTRKMQNDARAKARRRVPYFYWRLRRHFKLRAIVLHWQERTQRALYAPGGRGRAADAAAYAAECGGVLGA